MERLVFIFYNRTVLRSRRHCSIINIVVPVACVNQPFSKLVLYTFGRKRGVGVLTPCMAFGGGLVTAVLTVLAALLLVFVRPSGHASLCASYGQRHGCDGV